MAVQKVKVSETRLHKALSEELDKFEKQVAQWSKLLGCLPGLQEVQVQALPNPPFSHSKLIQLFLQKLFI